MGLSLSPFSPSLFPCVCGVCERMCAGVHALVQTQTSKEDVGCLPIIFHLFTFEQNLCPPEHRGLKYMKPALTFPFVGAEDLSQASVLVQQALCTLSRLSNAPPYAGLSHISPYYDVCVICMILCIYTYMHIHIYHCVG